MLRIVPYFTHYRRRRTMISTWAVLLLFTVGALSVERELYGKLNHKPRPRPSVSIYNGNKTSVAKYPYIASLDQDGNEYGAAVILNKNWLLTTAWNVKGLSPDELTFRVGSSFDDKQGQVLKASKIVAHPKYTGNYDYDIAVVKTTKPIKLGKKVKAIKLGTKTLKVGTKAWTAGWGIYNSTIETPENLFEAQVTVSDWKECYETYDYITKRCFCTFDKKVAPCGNDRGDPLVVKGVLYGLYAGGYECSPGFYPAVYTDVASLYKWVQGAIKSEEDDQE